MAQRPAGVRVCVAGAGCIGAVVAMEVDFKVWANGEQRTIHSL